MAAGARGFNRLLHAFGAVMDNPDLLVAAVVGDGEAETGPLAGSWKSIDFINPARDGAVLPILHLNGYKISGPTVLARHSDEQLAKFFEGQGYEPHFVEGDDPETVHQAFAAVSEAAVLKIRSIQESARKGGASERPLWPMIVLRTPKGWTGPKVVDGVQIEGTFRAHQVPVSEVKTNPEHLRILETWLHSYKPEELFDEQGRFRPEFAGLSPEGARRMGSNPHANGGKLRKPLALPSQPRNRSPGRRFRHRRAELSCARLPRVHSADCQEFPERVWPPQPLVCVPRSEAGVFGDESAGAGGCVAVGGGEGGGDGGDD